MEIIKKRTYTKKKELYYLNFSPLLKDCIFLILCLITKFFKTKIELLIKIKNCINSILNYLNIIEIITKIKIK